MATAFFPKAREQFSQGLINWTTASSLKTCLVNAATLGKAVTAATNATPIVVTSAAHGYANGDIVAICGAVGNTAANGMFSINNVTTNTFELRDYTTLANVAGNGTWTSGGRCVNLTAIQFLSAVTGVVATSGFLTTPTSALGILDADDVTYATVTGSQVDIILLYKDTGVAGTSTLILYTDSYTNLPMTPNGGGLNIVWSNLDFKIARL